MTIDVDGGDVIHEYVGLCCRYQISDGYRIRAVPVSSCNRCNKLFLISIERFEILRSFKQAEKLENISFRFRCKMK
jgi:hypothetical protein